MDIIRRTSTLKLLSSGTLHQYSFGVSVMNSWLKAQNPQGMQAGKQMNHSNIFWYFPNSSMAGSSSSKSKGS
jgi:hypothetical protein